MPRYLSLAENPYDLSNSEFDLSGDFDLAEERPSYQNYIFFPDQRGGGTYQHVKRFDKLTEKEFENLLNAVAPFQPGMNEQGSYELQEDGSLIEFGMSASEWKEQKRELKKARQEAKTEKLKGTAAMRAAKAAGIEGGTYEAPIAKIGKGAIEGAQKLAGSFLGGMVPNFQGSADFSLAPQAPPPAPGIAGVLANIPTWAKVGGAALLAFGVYKLATSNKK